MQLQKLKFVLGRIENIVGKRRICWLPAFSSLPTMFSKRFLSQGRLKSGLCGKELIHTSSNLDNDAF